MSQKHLSSTNLYKKNGKYFLDFVLPQVVEVFKQKSWPALQFKPFVIDLKGNTSRRFSSQVVVVSLTLRSCHKKTLPICCHMEMNSLMFLKMARNFLASQICRNLPCQL